MHSGDAGDMRPRGAFAGFAGRGHAAADADGLRGAVSVDGWGPLWTGLARVGGLLPPAERPHADPWALLRGRQHSSGRGGADGGAVGPAGRRYAADGPRFDQPVAPGGYAWWYVDAFSDATGPDGGRYGLTIIAFLGSVFSPYYAASRTRDPLDHCALNVALYGPGCRRWVMTERGRTAVTRGRDHLRIGPSAVYWDRDALTIEIEEVSAPLPRPVRGRIRVYPEQLAQTGFALDPAGRHRWHPIAPRARIEVEMEAPALRWQGDAYLDSNFGDEPLADGFRHWNWSRAHGRRDALLLYDGIRRSGEPFDMALRFDRQGRWHDVALPPSARLPRTLFAMPRTTHADAGHTPRVLATWEDAPFYARSAISTRLYGEEVRAVHESLALDRFRSPLVLGMLPYKMPRKTPWSILAGPAAPFLAR